MVEMPGGTKVLSIVPSGSSYWARTAKIAAIDPEGNGVSYFMNVKARLSSSYTPCPKLTHIFAGSPR